MTRLLGPNTSDMYAKRAADSLSVYNAEMEPPATSYAGVKSSLSSMLGMVNSRVTDRNSAVVSRKERMNGLFFNWAWGGRDMYKHSQSLPQSGGGMVPSVNSTAFQKVLIQLQDWQINSNWYIAYPMAGAVFNGSDEVRATYPSARVSVIQTNTSGGTGPSRMTSTPRYTAVQKIKKYRTSPRYYNTTSTNGTRVKAAAASNVNASGSGSMVNTPGVYRAFRR
jgi:hypothetical protein